MADIDISTEKRTPFKPPAKAAAAAQDKVRILIPKTKDNTADVFVSFNGTPYLLKRGVVIDVPRFVAHALELAVQTDYEEVADPVTGRKELVPQETMSYPFQYA